MPLTTAQLPILRAAIAAETNPVFVALRQANNGFGDEQGMADWYNAPTSPAFIAWRSLVTKAEITGDAAFDWTRVDNLSVGKARIWSEMFNGTFSFNPSRDNIRAGIAATWIGTAADLAVRAAVLAVCKRTALRGERVFASGTGSDAAPGLFTFEGKLTAQDVSDALRA